MDPEALFTSCLDDHLDLFARMRSLRGPVLRAAEALIGALKAGRKVLVCGNGGSAADAQHFCAELVGRFQRERDPLPAVALTTDSSVLTAVGNDGGFDRVFERQVKGLGRTGDVLVGISTSGNSINILRAVERAKEMGIQSIGLLGKDGGAVGARVDLAVVVPHAATGRIQEAHGFILHCWAQAVEEGLFPGRSG